MPTQRRDINAIDSSDEDDQSQGKQVTSKKQKDTSTNVEDEEDREARLQSLSEGVKLIGERLGMSLNEMEMVEGTSSVLDNLPSEHGTDLKIMLAVGLEQNKKILANQQLILKQSSSSSNQKGKSTSAGSEAVKVKLSPSAKTKIHELVMQTFYSPVVSAWSKASNQIVDIAWNLLSRNDHMLLKSLQSNFNLDAEGKKAVLKVIRDEVSRLRNELLEHAWNGSGKNKLIGEGNDKSLIQLANILIGKNDIKPTEAMLKRLAIFRAYIIEGEARKLIPDPKDPEPKPELRRKIYENDKNYWQEIDRKYKSKITEIIEKYPGDKDAQVKAIEKLVLRSFQFESGRDFVLTIDSPRRRWINKVYNLDLEEFGKVDDSDVEVENDGDDAVEEVAKSMESESASKSKKRKTVT